MRRRDFLERTGAALAAALASCRRGGDWKDLRLVASRSAGSIEHAALADASALLERATGFPVPVVEEGEPAGALDVLVHVVPSGKPPGSFRISTRRRGIDVAGADEEGARNGVYALLDHLGFGFFRDGASVPSLRGAASLAVELEESPAFRLRGDMIWDHYLGPKRFCAAMWDYEEWERTLLFLARNRMNFLEFYPPLEHVLARTFPEARGLEHGSVFAAEAKHELARKVLERGRAFGIRFMYVLTYGAFPGPVRKIYHELEWRNGFLCAHQPELAEMTERFWRTLVEELGTDHWYAVRHRGEEEQVYGDPCRSVKKAEGYLQAFDVLERVDPGAAVTVWTWGEKVPDLFETFPRNVRAAHVRHGMANVFGDRGEGREQADGAPALDPGRKWLSAQFTVFGGNETLLQTGWSDARPIARDAAESSRDPLCEGFFQWPEWSNTSPWLSHAIAKISWRPDALQELEPELSSYARLRHGNRAPAFLAGFRPLLEAGNALFMHPPRKRLVAPYFLSPESRKLLDDVREGARSMKTRLEGAPGPFRRDFVDLLTWVAVREVQIFEAAGQLESAETAWAALAKILSYSPELSIVESARGLSRVAPLSARAEESLWTLACDFYDGYPLVLSPEAIELVYIPQLRALGSRSLDEPGWFWHDFPDPRWTEGVKRLPREDSEALERGMRARLRDAIAGTDAPEVGPIDDDAVEVILSVRLPG